MTVPIIRVRDHIRSFLGLSDEAFAEREEHLKHQLARSNPVAALTRRTVGGALESLQTAPDRNALLQRLLVSQPERIAKDAVAEVCSLLPPIRGHITCHVIPNGGERGSGNCFGLDRFLVTVPCRGAAIPWVRFVVAHEYSHTHRGFVGVEKESVRDFLVLEGLAMVLGEFVCPEVGRLFQEEETDESIDRFWANADLDATGAEAYSREMGRPGAYEAGARIVRSYLNRHSVSIVEAHGLPSDELYRQSGCPSVR